MDGTASAVQDFGTGALYVELGVAHIAVLDGARLQCSEGRRSRCGPRGARLVVQHATSAFSAWRYAATVIRWRVTEAIKIEKTSQGRNHMKYKLLVGLVAALASSLLVLAAAKVDDPAITIAVGVDPAFTPFSSPMRRECSKRKA